MANGSGGGGVRGRRDRVLERAVGARVRALREQAGVSREQMAARTGLTDQQVRKLESAATIVNVSQLARMARVLGVRVGDFYPPEGLDGPDAHDGSGPPGPAIGSGGKTVAAEDGSPRDPMSHPETRALIRAYFQAPVTVRDHFLTLLQAYTTSRRL